MKFLGLVGSPRKKGNTEIMVDTFLEGAASAGAEVKSIFLQTLPSISVRGVSATACSSRGLRANASGMTWTRCCRRWRQQI